MKLEVPFGSVAGGTDPFLPKKEFRDGIFDLKLAQPMQPEPVFINLLRTPGIGSGSLFCLTGRYDSPIPTLFIAPIDCSKIPALVGTLLAAIQKETKPVAGTLSSVVNIPDVFF